MIRALRLVPLLAAAATVAPAPPVAAETVIAARTIRAKAVLGPQDLSSLGATLPGTFDKIEDVLGKEARVVIYAGRPIRPADIGPPALVDRNQIVQISFRRAGLTIRAEGRALNRGGLGDRIRVMNTDSHNTVTGIVRADGTIVVADHP